MNHFNAAGGMGFLIRELLGAGLLHEDVQTIMGTGLAGYTKEARLGADGELVYADAAAISGDESVLRPSARALPAHRRPQCARRQSRHRRDQVLLHSCRPACDRSAGPGVPLAGGAADGLQVGRAESRRGRRGALPGTQGQRHARTASAHAAAGGAAGARASALRSSPMAACRAHPARCPPPSI